MARGRLISKSLGSSRKFHALLQEGGKLGEFCQVLYPLIVANTDDFGRMAGDAFTVKNVVLPSSPRPERDFDQALTVLHEVGLLTRYVVNGSIYVEIDNFREHQPGLHQRGESRFPGPCGNPREIPAVAGNAVLREEKGREGKGREENPAPKVQRAREADSLFAQFWAAYPKKKAKEDAQRAWDKRRPNSELLTVILRALAHQKASPDWQKESGRYIPLPASWLNKARWTDEAEVEISASADPRRGLYVPTAEESRAIEQARQAEWEANKPTPEEDAATRALLQETKQALYQRRMAK